MHLSRSISASLILLGTLVGPLLHTVAAESLFEQLQNECGSCCDAGCTDTGCTDTGCSTGLLGSCFGCGDESALSFEGDITQFYQGVTRGGINENWKYGGHGDYRLGIDFGKLGIREGLSLKLRAEHRFGEFLSTDAGLITPASLHAASPTPASESLILTNVIFTQVVNENWIVFMGKLDTLDGDRNPFASDRGKTMFMNTSLLEPVSGIPTVPFATLGAGAVFMMEGMPVAQMMILNSSDTTTTSGFDELFQDGVAVMGGG